MRDVNDRRWEKPMEDAVPTPKDFGQVANELCEKALNDAKEQLHPLLRDAQLDRLDARPEFVQMFKSALEERIARTLAVWQPGVQAVFRFDETPVETWDGSIHLLVKVPRLTDTLKNLARKLDRSLVMYFRQLAWSRFQKRQSILEVQQVTPNELRHGIGYGAMFCAVYTAPVKVWPQNGLQDKRQRRS
jgi:oligoendopeptidase F